MRLQMAWLKRVALVAHPASVTADLTHSLDALAKCPEITLAAAFGPQHGLRGDKQDNMVESPDFTDPQHGIPVFSLYGEVRRPTGQAMGTFDVILIDLQDLGCRIYTFITTLLYILEAAAEHGKEVWVLDRPNPAGRPVEGLTLRAGWESFVGAGPIPMRHGLTMGELGQWFVDHFRSEVSRADGDYLSILDRWGAAFSDEQLFSFISDEIEACPVGMLEALADHLQVDPSGFGPLSPADLAERIVPRSAEGAAAGQLQDLLPRPSLVPVLQEIYAVSVEQFGRRLGRDLKRWVAGFGTPRVGGPLPRREIAVN
jgi:hypothetical protein